MDLRFVVRKIFHVVLIIPLRFYKTTTSGNSSHIPKFFYYCGCLYSTWHLDIIHLHREQTAIYSTRIYWIERNSHIRPLSTNIPGHCPFRCQDSVIFFSILIRYTLRSNLTVKLCSLSPISSTGNGNGKNNKTMVSFRFLPCFTVK